MHASTVHSPSFYKYASGSSHVATMAATIRKCSTELRDEVRTYLLLNESEECLSDSGFHMDNEVDDCALLNDGKRLQ
jgi:hypothetical protein